MKVQIYREACCAQDDQLGPLDRTLDVANNCNVGYLIATAMASRILQFSSTHTEMICRISGNEIAVVFSPHEVPAREAQFHVTPDTAITTLATTPSFEFVFDRN